MCDGLPQSALVNWLVAMSAQQRNWTLVVTRDGKRTQVVNLEKEVTRIGRDQSNDLALPDASVSRQHAEIYCGAEGVRIADIIASVARSVRT